MKENRTRIKVIHVLHSVGGVDVYLRLLTAHLDPDTFETIVIHGNSDTKKAFLDRKGQRLRDYRLPINREIRLIKDLWCIWKTARIFWREKPALVHAHSSKGGIIARAASLFYPVRVLHTPHAYSYLSEPRGAKRRIYLWIERLFRRINSRLLATSPSERVRGMEEVGYPEARALLFNNSIRDITPEQLLAPGIDLPARYICTVGRPSYQKNIEFMVEVIRVLKPRLPKIHLVVMGVGEYSPNKEVVEQKIKEYDLGQNLTLIPWIEREKIFSIIQNASLYISTARYEGLPYSVIEALALAKACVVTNCDGNRDLVEDGKNGYVISNYSADLMANRIFALLEDTQLKKTFEKNSRERFETRYNIEENIGQLEEIYREQAKK